MYSRLFRHIQIASIVKIVGYIVVLGGLGYSIAFSIDLAKRNNVFGLFTSQKHQAVVGIISTLNPLFVQPYTLEHGLSHLFLSGLTRYNDQNIITGDLAESWEILEGGKEFVISLRKDAYWSDGKQITVHDALFTYELTRSQDYQGWARDFFVDVEMEAIDDFTLNVTLPSAYMPFLDTLTLPILPRQLFLGNTVDQVKPMTFLANGVYSGDYVLKSAQRATLPNGVNYQRLVMERTSTNERTVLMLFDNELTMQTAFQLGLVDEMIFINPSELPFDDGLSVVYKPLLGQYAVLLINTEKISDMATRKAIIQSIDVSQLSGVPAVGPLSDRSPYWVEHSDVRIAFDPEGAGQILAGKEFRLTTLYTPRTEALLAMVQNDLIDRGVTLNTNVITTEEAFDTILDERDFELLLINQHIGRDPDTYSFWHSSQITSPGLNLVGLRNRRIDQALEKGRSNAEFDVRKDAYSEFQRMFLEQYPAVFLSHPYIVSVSRTTQVKYPQEIWEIEDIWLHPSE